MTSELNEYGLRQDFELAFPMIQNSSRKGDAGSFAPYLLNTLLSFDENDFDFSDNIEK